MAINLEGYYESVGNISKNLKEGMSGVGLAAGHGVDAIRRRKSQARAEGRAPGLMGWGVPAKIFGQKAQSFEAPTNLEEYRIAHGTDKTEQDYTDWLAEEHGGKWLSEGDTATRYEEEKKGLLQNVFNPQMPDSLAIGSLPTSGTSSAGFSKEQPRRMQKVARGQENLVNVFQKYIDSGQLKGQKMPQTPSEMSNSLSQFMMDNNLDRLNPRDLRRAVSLLETKLRGKI